MSLNSKVSWREGMLLLPQHFQQADRSLDASLHLRFKAQGLLNWGVVGLQFNEDAVSEGRLELLRCQAIFPDGLTLDIPDSDAAPAARPLRLTANSREAEVFLTVPARRSRMPIISDNAERADVRFLASVEEVSDDHDPERMRPVEVLRKNLRLAITGDALDGLVLLKIAEVQTTSAGAVVLRSTYIPPCPFISASPSLIRLARDLLGVIAARAGSLAKAQRDRGGGTIQFNASEVLKFWFQQTLNLHVPVLQHLLSLPGSHPALLYQELLRLLGGLSIFDPQSPADWLPYDHDRLIDCFSTLDTRLRALLGTLFKEEYESIPLTLKGSIWSGHIGDSQLLAHGDFYLLATGALTSSELAQRLPIQCKIGELDRVDSLARQGVAGLRLAWVPKPPSQVPVRGDETIFQLFPEGTLWQEVAKTGQLALWVPSTLKGIKLELVAIPRRER